MEIAKRDDLYKNPAHPYTQALLSAIPIPDPTVKKERSLLSFRVPLFCISIGSAIVSAIRILGLKEE